MEGNAEGKMRRGIACNTGWNGRAEGEMESDNVDDKW